MKIKVNQILSMLFMTAATCQQASAAELIINGDLTGTATNSHNGNAPVSWINRIGSTVTETVDTFDANLTTFGDYAWVDSPNGGTFANMLAHPLGSREGMEQNVSGFTIGESYELTFWQTTSFKTTSAYSAAGAEGYFSIKIGDTFYDADAAARTMAVPLKGVSAPWEQKSVVFTAAATDMNVVFRATLASGTNKIVSMGLDGVSIQAVPEPSSLTLVCGLVGLGLATRRR